MDIQDYLMDEMKRLNRLNDKCEKSINIGNVNGSEPKQIVNNVNAMCQIALTICDLKKNWVD